MINSKEIMMNMVRQKAKNNPMLSNLLTLADQGKGANIEQIARNLLKAQGYDFDTEFAKFRQQTGF